MGVAFAWMMLATYASTSHADGLSDMKSVLLRLQGQTPIKAQVEAKTWNRSGTGKDTEEFSGTASVMVEDDQRGLSVLLSKELLAKLDTEERAKEKDKKAKTPTLAALGDVNSTALRPLVSAASSITSMIEGKVFKAETMDTFDGKPARMLSFAPSIDALSEREKKVVKSLSGSLDIWIATDGTPLASRNVQVVHGSAFLVVSFDARNSDDRVYTVIGDRLVVVKYESTNSSSGMGETGETKTTKTLKVIS
ncbi:MAG: hypothetical protein ABI609_00875 [Acidobacteriota bacterium]